MGVARGTRWPRNCTHITPSGDAAARAVGYPDIGRPPRRETEGVLSLVARQMGLTNAAIDPPRLPDQSEPAGAAPALALCVHRDRDGACDRDRGTWPR